MRKAREIKAEALRPAGSGKPVNDLAVEAVEIGRMLGEELYAVLSEAQTTSPLEHAYESCGPGVNVNADRGCLACRAYWAVRAWDEWA